MREILQYTAETWGDETSDAYAASLLEATQRLTEFPAVGRAREDIRPGLRTFPVRQHLILYRVHSDTVRILRVLHARRDLQSGFANPSGRAGE